MVQILPSDGSQMVCYIGVGVVTKVCCVDSHIYIYIDMQCSEEKQKHTSPEQEVYRKIITTTEKPHTMKLTKQKHEHHKRQHRSREQEPTKT